MIEQNSLPITLAMTILTLWPISPFMFVVLLVAGIAVERRILKGRCTVATLAFYLRMFAHKGETRLVVIERRFLP